MPGAKRCSSSTTTTASNANAKVDATCPQCGAGFHCGYQDEPTGGDTKTGVFSCWCMDLPSVLPVPSGRGASADGGGVGMEGGGCLCPRCLAARVEAAMAGRDGRAQGKKKLNKGCSKWF